jgi:hypothetical protein
MVDTLCFYIRYLLAVAEHGNFTGTAEDLHISQPTLSQQLEDPEKSDFFVPLHSRFSCRRRQLVGVTLDPERRSCDELRTAFYGAKRNIISPNSCSRRLRIHLVMLHPHKVVWPERSSSMSSENPRPHL